VIVAVVAVDEVPASLTVDVVALVATPDEIVTAAGADDVVAVFAVDDVVSVGTDDDVVAGGAVEAVPARRHHQHPPVRQRVAKAVTRDIEVRCRCRCDDERREQQRTDHQRGASERTTGTDHDRSLLHRIRASHDPPPPRPRVPGTAAPRLANRAAHFPAQQALNICPHAPAGQRPPRR
jgi:hypothetical protein